MEFKERIVYTLVEALYDKHIYGLRDPETKALAFVKDSVNGIPCWRSPTSKEIKMYKEWRKKHEI